MSQPDDLRNELGSMRYFTPELFLQLNSSDSDTVNDAMEQWEKAIVAYKKRLRKIQREMPSQSRPVADLSLHDWNLVKIVTNPDTTGPGGVVTSASIVLKHNKCFVILWYFLRKKLQLIDAPKEWSLSKRRVHWLYDELDATGSGQGSLVHRILLSDGTTLLVPFSDCRVLQVNASTEMSHSDLMQIA